MSERERWVVYPLLFLALGASLRDKLFHLTQARSIVCESLAVFDHGDQTRPLAILGAERLYHAPGAQELDMIRVHRIEAETVQAKNFIQEGRRVSPRDGSQTVTMSQSDFARLWQLLQAALRAAGVGRGTPSRAVPQQQERPVGPQRPGPAVPPPLEVAPESATEAQESGTAGEAVGAPEE